MLDHHVLNLGEGNPVLEGEAKGTSEPNTNTLMRLLLLKANDVTIAGGAEVKRCPNTPWSKPNWQANLQGL